MGPRHAIRPPSPFVGVPSLIFCAQKRLWVGLLHLPDTALHWMLSFLTTPVRRGPTMGPTTGTVDRSGIPGSAGSPGTGNAGAAGASSLAMLEPECRSRIAFNGRISYPRAKANIPLGAASTNVVNARNTPKVDMLENFIVVKLKVRKYGWCLYFTARNVWPYITF